MRYGKARAVAGLLFLTLLGACAVLAPQTRNLLTHAPPGLPLSFELDVPYFAQTEHYCGPAALAMVLNGAGRPVTPDELAAQVYLPGRQGSLQVEMLAAARRNGMVAYVLAPDLGDLLLEINAGTPVITLENHGVPFYPAWHYAVAIGFDLHRREIIRHSGALRAQATPLSLFEHFWSKEGRWAMVATPPGRVPVTATEPRYAEAVIALEKIGRTREAAVAYEAMLARWPASLVALMGRGNTAHAIGDLALAETAFREATLRHASSAAALNNLAQTLADRGKLDEARTTAERAVALGGPLKARAEATLQDIHHKQRAAQSPRP